MYIVAGATGNTGSVVADSLLEQRKPVTVIVRSEEKGKPWAAKGAKLALGTLDDGQTLAQILRGAEGAYILTPPNIHAVDFVEERQKLTQSIARAVKDSGIGHVVLLSSIGAQHASGTGLILGSHIAESALGSAAKNLTVIRAGFFLENWGPALGGAQANGVLPTLLAPDRKIPMLATRDIGRVAAESLLHPARGRRIVELAGPREYSPEDIASVLSSLLGRDVRVQNLSPGAPTQMFKSFGATDEVARLFEEIYTGLNSGRIAYEGGSAEFRRGSVSPEEAFAGMLRQTGQMQAGA
ncbi:MAG TPA: NmrA family NAD(P)-binding protein [Bryobacteraceae bacterium]|jgi:uncharacterized protein YbjT (DUF2867 family)|nr:NmrA family NAD(P)-binding protein [Bryobacteraceae bacterium]